MLSKITSSQNEYIQLANITMYLYNIVILALRILVRLVYP